MAKVWCCRRFQDAYIYKITPTRKNILEEFVLYRSSCSYCSRPVLEILRIDDSDTLLEPVRLNSKNIHNFVDSMDVLWKSKRNFRSKHHFSKFVLGYNEFGKIKKCTKNFSSLSLGKIETNPFINLKTYKHYSQLNFF